jgi:hypothetical protein
VEVDDLPLGSAFRDDERHPPWRADRLAVAHRGRFIEAGDDDRTIVEHARRVAEELGAARPVRQQCALEVLADAFRVEHYRAAASAEEQRIGRVERDDRVDV